MENVGPLPYDSSNPLPAKAAGLSPPPWLVGLLDWACGLCLTHWDGGEGGQAYGDGTFWRAL